MFLVYLNVLVDILAADKGIEEDVGQHTDDQPVALDDADAGSVGQGLLDEGHDATTYHQRHEDAGSSLGVLAQSLYREVEDATPHDGRAETASGDEQTAGRNLYATDGDGHRLRHEDGNQQEEDGYR